MIAPMTEPPPGMAQAVSLIAIGALQDLRRSFRSLALTDIAYKAIAFAALTPATLLLLRWAMSSAEGSVIADVDIAAFFLTRPVGILTLVAGSALLLAITALEMACLIAIGFVAAEEKRLHVRDALAFVAARTVPVLRLTANMVVRLLAGLLPFLAAGGIAYWALLREYDINYYLTERPPAFWAAGAIAVTLVVVLLGMLVRTMARWALSLPLVLFEDIGPRQALAESARRSAGRRALVIVVLASWGVLALLLLAAATWIPEVLGRTLAPLLSGSLPVLLSLIAGLAMLWAALGLAAGIVNASLFALLLIHLYRRIGSPRIARSPASAGRGYTVADLPRSILYGVAATAILAFLGLSLVVVGVARRNNPVLVIAHRGSSAAAPENSLAAFRLAASEGADYIELDVQESSDGELVVVHDSDLMRVGGSPLKVWEADAAALRTVDIGGRTSPQFSAERVPTLAEALAVAKGRSRVIVELKSYGHDQQLEERVIRVVEAAGMENDSVFMSLNHEMVRKLKQLRPSWRAGVLIAKAIGDATTLGGDFLAVEARVATRSFVRQAHRADQDVYVWTVNDPAWMLSAMSHGVDGLITDVPAIARGVVERRANMSDAQRVLVALLVRLGARTDALAAEDALQP